MSVQTKQNGGGLVVLSCGMIAQDPERRLAGHALMEFGLGVILWAHVPENFESRGMKATWLESGFLPVPAGHCN